MGFWSTMEGAQWASNKFRKGFQDFSSTISLGGSDDANQTIRNFTGQTAQANQEEEWRRQDSEYARTLQSMTEAGLNPSMLYGGSSGNITTGTSGSNPGSSIGQLGSILGAVQNFKLSSAQADYYNAQAQSIRDNDPGEGFGSKHATQVLADIKASTDQKLNAVSEAIQKFENAKKNNAISGMTIPYSFGFAESLGVAVDAFKLGGFNVNESFSKNQNLAIPIEWYRDLYSTDPETQKAAATLIYGYVSHSVEKISKDALNTAPTKAVDIPVVKDIPKTKKESYIPPRYDPKNYYK